MGKERLSSSKKIHVTYSGKQDLEFGEGKVIKLKEDPCSFIMGKESFSSSQSIKKSLDFDLGKI
jgi:hypothetical protein